MAFVNQDPNKTFPPNPTKFEPYGTEYWNQEQKNLGALLQSILDQLGGKNGIVLNQAEQISLSGIGSDVPTFSPSAASLVNNVDNDSTAEIVINTAAGGPVTYVLQPGDTLNLAYYPEHTYDINSLRNNGGGVVDYFAQEFVNA